MKYYSQVQNPFDTKVIQIPYLNIVCRFSCTTSGILGFSGCRFFCIILEKSFFPDFVQENMHSKNTYHVLIKCQEYI